MLAGWLYEPVPGEQHSRCIRLPRSKGLPGGAVASDWYWCAGSWPAVCLSNLADLYSEQGKYAQAEVFSQRALTTLERTLGEAHPLTWEWQQEYASLLKTLGRSQPE